MVKRKGLPPCAVPSSECMQDARIIHFPKRHTKEPRVSVFQAARLAAHSVQEQLAAGDQSASRECVAGSCLGATRDSVLICVPLSEPLRVQLFP